MDGIDCLDFNETHGYCPTKQKGEGNLIIFSVQFEINITNRLL